MKKNINTILILILVLTQLYSITKINSLENQLMNLDNNLNNNISYLSSNISSISSDINYQLTEQSSLINSFDVLVGDLKTNDNNAPTCSVTFSVIPKATRENMSVFLYIDEELLKLEKNGVEFTKTKDYSITDSLSTTEGRQI